LVSDGFQQAGREPVDQNPALAVLPFVAQSSNLDDSFLGDGIASEIVRELNLFPDIRLYLLPPGPENSDLSVTVERGREFGVDYIVAGDVRSEGSAVRITAKLVEAQTGKIIWTETYEEDIKPHSLFAVQGKIAAGIASSLGQSYGVVKTDLASRLSNQFTSNMDSYECVLRAYAYRRGFSEALHAPVLGCLEETVRQDPDYAEAWAMLAWLYLDTGRFGYVPEIEIPAVYRKALDTAHHAVRLDGKSIMGLKALSSINHYMGNYEDGEKYAREALLINPNDPDTLAQLGWRLAVRGNFAEGIPLLQHAIERTVNPPGWYYHLIAVDHFLQGRYSEMLSAVERSNVSDDSFIRWSLAAIAHGALGNQAAAQEALAKMREVWPEAARDPAAVYRRHRAADTIVDALVAGLRKAGWTESDVHH